MLGGDREPEPRAAAGARRVGLVEAVEEPRERLRRHARPAVRDDDRRAGDRHRQRHLHRAARGVVTRVVHEVPDDPVQPPRVRRDDHGLAGQGDRGAREPRRDHRGDEPPEVDRLQADGLGVGVEARDLHELVDEVAEAADVGDQELRGAPAVRGHAVEAALDQRRLGDQRRQRRAQLVRHVRGEPSVLLLRGLEPADRRLEGVGHAVELGAPAPELVASAGGHPRREVASRDPPRRPRRVVHRPEDAARDEPGGDQRHEDGDQPAREEPEAELREGRIDAGRREDEEQVRPTARPPADDRAPGSRRASARHSRAVRSRRSRAGRARSRRAPRGGGRACTGCRRRSRRSSRPRRAAGTPPGGRWRRSSRRRSAAEPGRAAGPRG